jgi:hypothetical protein
MKTLALAAVLVAAATTAGAADSCEGTFAVGGSTVHLTSAYATIDRLFSEPGKDYLRVVLSDVPVPPAAAADDFALQKLTRDKGLHAVVLIVSPDKQVVSTQLYDAAFKMDSVSSAGTNNRFEPSARGSSDKGIISGKAYTKDPREFRGVRYEYTATFVAAIHRAP